MVLAAGQRAWFKSSCSTNHTFTCRAETERIPKTLQADSSRDRNCLPAGGKLQWLHGNKEKHWYNCSNTKESMVSGVVEEILLSVQQRDLV